MESIIITPLRESLNKMSLQNDIFLTSGVYAIFGIVSQPVRPIMKIVASKRYFFMFYPELVFLPRAAAYQNGEPTVGRQVRENQVGGFAGLSAGNGYAVGCWHIKTWIFGRIRKLEKNGLEIEQEAEKSPGNLRKL
jgi:hypothetical protein